MSEVKKYTINALVKNTSGVLARVAGLFAKRAYNVHSICACATEDPEFSRMTIILNGDEHELYQVIKQMDKLEDVKKIGCADELDCVRRDLLLVKVRALPEMRSQIIEINDIYKAKTVDLSSNTMILELTGVPEKIDAFLKVIEPYGILEMQRTGVNVLARGEHTLKDRDCYSDHIN